MPFSLFGMTFFQFEELLIALTVAVVTLRVFLKVVRMWVRRDQENLLITSSNATLDFLSKTQTFNAAAARLVAANPNSEQSPTQPTQSSAS
jgi:hypothetical protein